MKIAIVHYWLVRMRGGEKVIEALCELYPDADIFTHVLDQDALSETIKRHSIQTTFINKLPRASKWYKNYLPFMPLALETLDLSKYDLVISSESGPAKGIITNPEALHICYCHTPMRYVWDMYHEYVGKQFFLKRWLMHPLLHYVRNWDAISAGRVDFFVSNSNYIAKRISKFYRRNAETIHPPVDLNRFQAVQQKKDFYLLLGQLVSYKRADIAIQAFNENNRSLIVIGDGEQANELKQQANGNIKFLGWQDAKQIETHLQDAKALIFPGVEDFGIVPLEAMASGTPVIAYARGGALETVIDGQTGLHFGQQTSTSLNAAINEFENRDTPFDANVLRRHANAFSKTRFKQAFSKFVEAKLTQPEN